MPKNRTREHELEVESRRLFESTTPSGWSCRPVPEDYGIDLEVEIFENHRSTGLTFKVQLKATDADTNKKSIRRVDFEYWASLDVPVLIAHYSTATGKLLTRWAHGVDPWPVKPDQKTTTVTFNESYSDHLARIAGEVRNIREVRTRAATGQLSVVVSGANSVQVAQRRHDVHTFLTTHHLGHRLAVSTDINAFLRVQLSDDQVRISAPADSASVTLHRSDKDTGPYDVATADLLAATATVMSHAGAEQGAADILANCLPEISADALNSIGTGIAGTLAAAGRMRTLIDLLSDARVTSAGFKELLFLQILPHSAALESGEADDVLNIARTTAATVQAQGDRGSAGRWLYNTAQIFVQRDDWALVDQLLGDAEQLTTRYETSATFHRTRGNAAWNTEKFAAAVGHYTRAWDLGWQTPTARAALSEALIMAGQYGRAHRLLTVAEPAVLTRWARLLRLVVADVVERLGITRQDRRPYAAAAADAPTQDDSPEVLLAALKERDAVNAVLLGWYFESQGELRLGQLVWIAVLTEDVGRWVLALGCAHMVEDDESYLQAIIQTATMSTPDFAAQFRSAFGILTSEPHEDFLTWVENEAAATELYTKPPMTHLDLDVDEN